MERQLKILKDGDIVEFDWKDMNPPTPGQSLGRAEFAICYKWKYGKLDDVYITPQQQRNVKFNYKIEGYGADSLSVESYAHKGFDNPKIWIHGWCKEHKCPFFRVYPPANVKHFRISTLSSLCINFDA